MKESAAAWNAARARQVISMRLTLKSLGHIVLRLSDEEARSLRDGADGWSIMEIVCHLRDFDEIFYQRAQMMLTQEHPQLPAYDHEAMAIERNYQADSLAQAYDALRTSRARFVDFFKGLSEEDWARGGIHPERDSFSMTDAAMQIPLHDLDHIEQITRVLASG
ncbi:MAG: DinB family protein [Chloroflexi bacterium]|nr:DinB family protein [Chloroflexota bacterium]MYC55749.1 DinB family protein [Chloroflexota bacterium]MYD38645.1 DinB family protein [Chloroflexota bacterium]